MMGLYFLLLFSVGILKPIKNVLALDGLAESDFYKVYLVSAFVILLAPLFNQLSNRVAWRTLIPGTAAFFTINLVLFRLIYVPGSGLFGMVFYGWYDLFAAALVTQFFMAVQIFFNARDAKSAIPLVIAAGSVGATLGNLTSGALARVVGTPNLLGLAAVFVAAFAMALPFIWTGYPPVRPPERAGRRVEAQVSRGDFMRVFSNRHIRMIAGLVLITIVVKTLVDYEFNEAVGAFFPDVDAKASFQGYVFAVLGPLPILILLPFGSFLKRWGVGAAVMILPLAVLTSTTVLVLAFGLWTATIAKGAEQTFRYSAERTAREVLYVPVPADVKLKAKAYIDMAVEKGLGKGATGLLIFGLLFVLSDFRQIAWVALGLAVAWCFMALAAKRRYVVALAESIRGRFANVEAGFATLTERSTIAMIEAALRGDTTDVEFALDLIEQAGSVDAQHLADEMELLLDHPEERIRTRVLRLLTRFPDLVPEEPIRERLSDASESVREAAVEALAAKRSEPSAVEDLLEGLLISPSADHRCAVLSWLVRGGGSPELRRSFGEAHARTLQANADVAGDLDRVLDSRDSSLRREAALTAGLLDAGPAAERVLGALLDDEDSSVREAAIRGAAASRSNPLHRRLVTKLGEPSQRGPAREALAEMGADVADLCEERLRDPSESPRVRRSIPTVLARAPHQRSVDALLRAVANREIPRDVRFQSLKALNKLRSRDGGTLEFEMSSTISAIEFEADEASRYLGLRAALESLPRDQAGPALLRDALDEAWADRREAVFRLLGLVYAPDQMYRAYSAVTHSDDRARANALELIEGTVGRELFGRVSSVLPGAAGAAHAAPQLETALDDLAGDAESWLASLASWHRDGAPASNPSATENGMDLIQKVFLLQKVDLLQGARSADLGLLASIADEVDVEAGEVLLRRGEPSDALYVVVRGSVELDGVGEQTLTLGPNTPFGTWSLIDSDPSVVGAKATEPTVLLRITRSDFQELLEEHPDLVAGVLQALARRIRSLVA